MADAPQGPYGLPPTGQPTPLADGEFVPAIKNRDVNFATCEIDPPSAEYLDVDDVLVLEVIQNGSFNTVNANLRILRPHGRIETVQLSVVGTVGNTLQSVTRNEREGYILSAMVVSAATVNAGNPIFARLGIRRGATGPANEFRVLCAGYLTTSQGMSWPDRQPMQSAEGPGWPLSISVGNPAAGADWTYTLPTTQRLDVYGVHALLTTSATAGTRTVTLKVTDGANTLFLIDATNTQAISLAYDYTMYPSSFAGGSAGTHQYIPLPEPLVLMQGWTIGTTTANISATDQWSAIRITALSWFDIL